MEFSLHLMFALFISSISCNAVKVSKACFGQQGFECTRHKLTCSSGRIAIQEAFYMNKTVCPYVGTDCHKVNVSGVSLNGTRYNFSGIELDAVYRKCSTQTTCSLPGDRADGADEAGFSAIVYQCINVATAATTIELTTTKTTRTKQTTPTISSVTSSGSSSAVQPDQTTMTEIGTGTTTTVSGHGNNTKVYKGTTETIASEQARKSSLSTARTGTTDASSQEQKTETNYGFGGIFAAGLFTGLGIAVVILGVVYFVYIRRRCVVKRPDPGPASLSHPTYSGLTDLARPDTYDVINQPEGWTRPSEPSQTPVYQNVADAS